MKNAYIAALIVAVVVGTFALGWWHLGLIPIAVVGGALIPLQTTRMPMWLAASMSLSLALYLASIAKSMSNTVTHAALMDTFFVVVPLALGLFVGRKYQQHVR